MGVDSDLGAFLGESAAMSRVLDIARRASQVEVPVLLVGETGTGKSHLARLIHEDGARGRGPFVTVNCAGIPEGLFESELFGHRRGAFTGAVESRTGLFELASGGTLFLDEVGDLPLAQQAKLLSVLETRRVRPVGATSERSVDTRVMAASSKDPLLGVERGTFRPDLYHRLALLRCELPPLRERALDLPALVRHFLRQLALRYGRSSLALAPEAREILMAHPWPGNVRELAHVLEAAVILSGADTLQGDHVARVLLQPAVAGAAPRGTGGGPESAGGSGATDEVRGRPGRYSFFGSEKEEEESIREALVRCKGNRTRAARLLGMARNTLRQRIERYGLGSQGRPSSRETFEGREA